MKGQVFKREQIAGLHQKQRSAAGTRVLAFGVRVLDTRTLATFAHYAQVVFIAQIQRLVVKPIAHFNHRARVFVERLHHVIQCALHRAKIRVPVVIDRHTVAAWRSRLGAKAPLACADAREVLAIDLP